MNREQEAATKEQGATIRAAKNQMTDLMTDKLTPSCLLTLLGSLSLSLSHTHTHTHTQQQSLPRIWESQYHNDPFVSFLRLLMTRLEKAPMLNLRSLSLSDQKEEENTNLRNESSDGKSEKETKGPGRSLLFRPLFSDHQRLCLLPASSFVALWPAVAMCARYV